MLTNSSYQPLADLAIKIRGEIRYHTIHANTWIKQLGSATQESVERLQDSLNVAMPYALGIFEPSPMEDQIIAEGIFPGEEALKSAWLEQVEKILSETQLQLPDIQTITPTYGGRTGEHTEHLQPLLDEMSEVFRIDPTADW
jgi:ring-1,2-phenylacetyl-CoA epoxidase subunit PaaC